MSDRTSSFKASAHSHDGKYHILLAATGSVASIKLPSIARALGAISAKLSIRIILTAAASRFLIGQSVEQPHHSTLVDLPGVDGVYMDDDEWSKPWARLPRGDGDVTSTTSPDILHIELRRWADVLLVAPLSANSLAKMVNGMCDNLLLSVIRAWDVTGLLDGGDRREAMMLRREVKRIFVAPAMNTMMWVHPITARQLEVLDKEWGYGQHHGHIPGWVSVIYPMQKSLACGDVGTGAMEDWKIICQMMHEHITAEDFQL